MTLNDAMPSHASRVPDVRSLPGFNEAKHRSSLIDEFVEVRNGLTMVVYRTKPEITEAALKRFKIPAFKR